MERVFLFCFRSCLKGDSDHEYYDILEIDNPNLATIEVIKKQYKKLSLNLHPDKLAQRGVEVTAEHKQQFLKVKEAYDVLSDPKRKRLYDQLGVTGLKLMENPTEVDPMQILRNYQKNHKDRCFVVLFVGFIFAALLLLPILFSLKCDGTLDDNVKWVAIWTPMWILDVIQLLTAVFVLADNSEPPSPEEGEDPPEPKAPFLERLHDFVVTTLFILLQIFVLMRLDSYIDWSWFLVFVPWFIYEFVNATYIFPLAFLTKISPPDYENMQLVEEGGEEERFMKKIELESKYFDKVIEQTDAQKSILVCGLKAWLAVFLALKVDGTVDWNWGLVLLPVWVYLFLQYSYAYIYRVWGAQKLKGLDVEAITSGEEKDPNAIVNLQQGSQLLSISTLLCISQCAPLFMALLLVSRLQVSTFTTFVIILPVFIAIGCCCCGVFCGICIMSVVDMDSVEQQQGDAKNSNKDSKNGDGYNPPTSGDNDKVYSSTADIESSGARSAHSNAIQIIETSAKSPFQQSPPATEMQEKLSPEPTALRFEQVEVDID